MIEFYEETGRFPVASLRVLPGVGLEEVARPGTRYGVPKIVLGPGGRLVIPTEL